MPTCIWWRSGRAKLYTGGRYSFVSSHAANHMGIAVLMGDCSGASWASAAWCWAVLIGWSRIHLGVHYPGDVLGGFIVGWGLGALALTIRALDASLFEPHPMAPITAMTWLAVFLGGGLGSVLRFGLGQGLGVHDCRLPTPPFHGRSWRPTSWPRDFWPGPPWRAPTLWGKVLAHVVLPHGGGVWRLQHLFHVCVGHVAPDATRWMDAGVGQRGRFCGGLRGCHRWWVAKSCATS